MKSYSGILKEDFILEDDLHITGETTAYGSIQAFSLLSEGPLTVNEDLVTTRGSITAKSALKIGKNVISAENITVEGVCEINGNVRGKKIRFSGKSVKVCAIDGENIELWGDIEVEADLHASESISIPIHPKRRGPRINGVVNAPIVTIFYGGLFSKWVLLPDRILKRLRKQTRMKKVFLIKDLSIKAKELVIRSRYPSDRVDVKFIDSNIDVSNINFIQSDLIGKI
jgi:cytoskeletal protein CcmA (bactofilin family)